MRWIEEPLAALQQAAAAAWLSTRALLWTRSSIILKKTQGSLYSRRSRLGEEPYSSPRQLISTALSLGLTPLQTNHPHSPPPLPPPSPTATNHWRSRVSPGRHNGSTSGRRRQGAAGSTRRYRSNVSSVDAVIVSTPMGKKSERSGFGGAREELGLPLGKKLGYPTFPKTENPNGR